MFVLPFSQDTGIIAAAGGQIKVLCSPSPRTQELLQQPGAKSKFCAPLLPGHRNYCSSRGPNQSLVLPFSQDTGIIAAAGGQIKVLCSPSPRTQELLQQPGAKSKFSAPLLPGHRNYCSSRGPNQSFVLPFSQDTGIIAAAGGQIKVLCPLLPGHRNYCGSRGPNQSTLHLILALL